MWGGECVIEQMGAVFILGMLGGLLVGRWSERNGVPMFFFVVIAVAIFILLPQPSGKSLLEIIVGLLAESR